MEPNITFLYENIQFGLDTLPTIVNKTRNKDWVYKNFPGVEDAYKLGHTLSDTFYEIQKDDDSHRKLMSSLYEEDFLKEDPIYFTIILGMAGSFVTHHLNDENALEEYYNNFISDILKAQKTSLIDLHKTALEVSSLLKMSVLSFEMKNEGEGSRIRIKNILKKASHVVAITFLLSTILNK